MKRLYLILAVFFPLLATGQEVAIDTEDSTCVQRDLAAVIRTALDKPPKPDSENAGSILLVPIIGSNPATGFMIGIGGQYAFRVPGEGTRYSMLSSSVQLTTKNQQIYLLKNNIYTRFNNIFLSGDWRYMVYSQSTYGLGTTAPEGGILDYQFHLAGQETSDDSLAQPLTFDFLRFYQTINFRVKKTFYVGVGYYLDAYSNIVDEKLRLNPGDSLVTSHYAYNEYYGFSQKKYHASSLGINLISDTRDNMLNPYSGYFAMVSWNGNLFGSEEFSHFISFEWRSFHPLSTSNPRHLIAFWALGNFMRDGELPYLILPATAYDQRSRSGRGYTQGRFRGNHLVYGEAEYRFPISECGGLWGGVLFLNATSANNPAASLDLFESIRPGYGAGLRLMVDKKSRTNLALDFGFGKNSFGFYLAASETF